jgi:hypothetical protein
VPQCTKPYQCVPLSNTFPLPSLTSLSAMSPPQKNLRPTLDTFFFCSSRQILREPRFGWLS